MLNEVKLIGRVGQTPELKGDITKVVNLSLATTEKWKKDGETKEKTEWHRLVFWGKLAEIVAKYVSKGSLIYISGKLVTEKWQDKDGRDVYTTKINVRDMKMLSGREHQDEVKEEAKPEDAPTPDDLPEDADDSGLPF